MPLHLFDTAARAVRPFEPLVSGRVSIYVCGATVQSEPHIGHVRSAVNFDILRRWLLASGYDVTYIRNVTDIDDKILSKAAEHDTPWWQWAQAHERLFAAAYDTLGCLQPSYEPRATGHVPEMIALIGRLIETGHAYLADGGVYFAVSTLDDYGALSGQRPADMQPAADSLTAAKRDPRDFALWKAARPGEPSWDTPWGPGRPGWHLECSAMATKYCGAQFDIHGGGLDLVFPHHENERAQSLAAGDLFARYWLHNSWVTAAGEKMSKSLGNTLSIAALLEIVRPVELRYYLGAAHYRSTIEFSRESLQEAAAGFRRIEDFVRRATEHGAEHGAGRSAVPARAASTTTEPTGAAGHGALPGAFVAAMDDDLGVPAALAVLHQEVTRGNQALAAGNDDAAAKALAGVRAMADVLGIDPLAANWSRGGSDDGFRAVAAALIEDLLQDRRAARAARDFARADAIRARLADLGVDLADAADATHWTLRRDHHGR